MSFVVTQPESLAAAARVPHGFGSAVAAHNSTAAVISTAADEITDLAATQFVAHVPTCQAVSAEAEAVHAATEPANAIAAG
jgi:hypothetical protein